MTLFEVRDVLKASGPATAAAIALRGKITLVEAEILLEHWVRRGKAAEVDGGCHTGGLCKTCGGCSSSKLRWFQWTAAEEPVSV